MKGRLQESRTRKFQEANLGVVFCGEVVNKDEELGGMRRVRNGRVQMATGKAIRGVGMGGRSWGERLNTSGERRVRR